MQVVRVHVLLFLIFLVKPDKLYRDHHDQSDPSNTLDRFEKEDVPLDLASLRIV